MHAVVHRSADEREPAGSLSPAPKHSGPSPRHQSWAPKALRDNDRPGPGALASPSSRRELATTTRSAPLSADSPGRSLEPSHHKKVTHMMPQDFPSSGMKQATSLAAVHAFDAGTATALVRVERELRELWQRSVGPEVGRNGLPPQVVPALAALTDRVEALTLELRARRPSRHPAAARLCTPHRQHAWETRSGPTIHRRKVTSAGAFYPHFASAGERSRGTASRARCPDREAVRM